MTTSDYGCGYAEPTEVAPAGGYAAALERHTIAGGASCDRADAASAGRCGGLGYALCCSGATPSRLAGSARPLASRSRSCDSR
jgi:hypothetical protein